MRRIVLMGTAMLVMAAMVVAVSVPAFAAKPHQGQCVYENGETRCTETQLLTSGAEVSTTREAHYCGDERYATVITTTYRPYTDYRVTETTYYGKSQQVKSQTTTVEREYHTPYTTTSGGC